jgi:hypothetical protein
MVPDDIDNPGSRYATDHNHARLHTRKSEALLARQENGEQGPGGHQAPNPYTDKTRGHHDTHHHQIREVAAKHNPDSERQRERTADGQERYLTLFSQCPRNSAPWRRRTRSDMDCICGDRSIVGALVVQTTRVSGRLAVVSQRSGG